MLAVPILLTCVKGTLRLCPILEDKPEVLFLPPLPSSRNGTCVAMQTMRREARSAGLIYLARCKTDEKRQHLQLGSRILKRPSYSIRLLFHINSLLSHVPK